MPTINVTGETLDQLDELRQRFGQKSIDLTLSGVVGSYHAAYLSNGELLPDGWKLRDGLTLGDLEAYYDHWSTEKPVSQWAERGRVIRSAIAAGWFAEPKTVEDVKGLKPREATQLAAAIDGLYTRTTTADPNS